MSVNKKQINLLKSIRSIRKNYQEVILSKRHWRFLFGFLLDHRLSFVILVFLFFSQGLIEAIFIIFSRNQISGGLLPFFWEFLGLLLCLFFLNSYFSIRQEKTLGVLFANALRKRIFEDYLRRPSASLNQKNQADLIAKMSYQLPLASMGVVNSFFGALRWLINILVVLILLIKSDLSWSLALLFSLIFSAVIGLISYFISKSYVSQEVTFYSQIIREVGISTNDRSFLKIFNQEKKVLQRFDQLVDFDSFFRIRRDLWLKLSVKILFALLLLLSLWFHFSSSNLLLEFNLISSEKKIILLFLFIYFSRILYESLRVGLYLWPAQLGLYLTIPKSGRNFCRDRVLEFETSLNFYGRKLKLFLGASYQKNFSWFFEKGNRYLFYSPSSTGKSSLARAFSGLEVFEPKSLRIKIDGKRLDFQSWQRFSEGICFIDPNFFSEKSIFEFIIGQNRKNQDLPSVESVFQVLRLYPELLTRISREGNFNVSAASVLGSPISAFALYLARCLVSKPALVVIDNFWLDLAYEEINKMLLLLDQELPNSIIVVFSRKDNSYFNYHQKYELN